MGGKATGSWEQQLKGGEKTVSVPQAIIIAAMIVAGAIIGSRYIPHYEISAAGGGAYRLNSITGEVIVCISRGSASSPYTVVCE
ncbi:MAG TPA: hypothetical protein VF957_23580 [Bradyrhizobium sp.]